MVKVKKSFLEKITGSRRVENESFEPEIDTGAEVYEESELIMNQPSSNREMAEEENDFSNDGSGELTIDVYQTDNDIVIKSTIAGVKPEDLDVSINNDMVTVKGERRNDEEISEDNYYYQECYWGKFSRSVILPVDVISDKAEASMKNGILTIRLPKADNTKTKRIQVRGF